MAARDGGIQVYDEIGEKSEIEALMRDQTPEQLAREVTRLRKDCAEAYQAVGVLADRLGYSGGDASGDLPVPITKLLDNLSDAAAGDPRRHPDVLPFILPGASTPAGGRFITL